MLRLQKIVTLQMYATTRISSTTVLNNIRGYRKFKCVNCVNVPDYLLDLVPSVKSAANHTSTLTQLTEALKQSDYENENLKLSNLALLNKSKQLQEEMQNGAVSKNGKQEGVKQLEAPDTLKKLETVINYKMKEVGKSIEENLLKHVEQNNKQMETKLIQLMAQNESYSKTANNIQAEITVNRNNILKYSEVLAGHKGPNDLKKLMQEAKIEEVNEKWEQQKRQNNFIIHGIEEKGEEIVDKDTNHIESRDINDKQAVHRFLQNIEVICRPKSIIRLGKPNEKNSRPLKITLPSTKEKENIMNSLKRLKGSEEFGKVRVTHDYTRHERELIKQKVKEAEERSKADAEKIWRVRGDPKTGLHLKDFARRNENTATRVNQLDREDIIRTSVS